jgi:tRNA uridine 5-carboxymethylaminomethyl modification enzyme
MMQSLKVNEPNDPYDVIICGAGHAGCEAALAAAKQNADVLLLTGNLDTIAQMSCNPAIGGQGKGQIVREIDALGGEMALNTDLTAIQFKLLNTSKGKAVQAPRAQCDKKAYQLRMKHVLELQDNLILFQAMVNGLIVKDKVCVGVKTNMGLCFYSKTVVVTTGTFLEASTHIGQTKGKGGRLGDHQAKGLSADFISNGIELKRFKTGTPPRLLGKSLNLEGLERQSGDKHPTKFAFYDSRIEPDVFHVEHSGKWLKKNFNYLGSNLVDCFVTETSTAAHNIINSNLDQSPLYRGDIVGTGPRYCPSIEDKVVRFSSKTSHKLHLEPEGVNSDEWYINGLSTSLPFDIQQSVLHSIKGLENAIMIRPAYAVEYDYAPPTQLSHTLESLVIPSLFFAGQINGTSGYEEAGAQGLVAGLNAALKALNQSPFHIGRDEGYIGVLIDDLTTKGVTEPYRMFTSRAEHRLLFNHGSAEHRLYQKSRSYGLLSDSRLDTIGINIASTLEWVCKLSKIKASDGKSFSHHIKSKSLCITEFPNDFLSLPKTVQEEVLYRIEYDGYLQREIKAAKRIKLSDQLHIPSDFNYDLPGLRKESVENLTRVKPSTLGQASRISGINPSDISILHIYLNKNCHK